MELLSCVSLSCSFELDTMPVPFLSDRGTAVCMCLPVLVENRCSEVTLLCTSKNGNAKGVFNDAIVGSQALGNMYQTNDFQKCFCLG